MIRIEANYPATDGSAPERIEITWEDVTPTGGELAVLVEVLGRVAQRYAIPESNEGRLRTEDHARRIRADVIRQAIAAIATLGPIPGERWMAELERFAQIVEAEGSDG